MKSWVILVYYHLCYHGGDIVWYPRLPETVGKGILDHVTHKPFCLCAQDIKGHRGHHIFCCFIGEEQVTDLWPVTVSDHDSVFAIK